MIHEDNQQERLDAARLAMFFDTDGFITMRIDNQRNTVDITPHAALTNTNKDLIEWAASALKRFGIGHYVHLDRLASKTPAYKIHIAGMKRMKKLLTVIRPWLISKARHAELIQEFIDSRLPNWAKRTYTDREFQIADEVRSLSIKGKRSESSTSIRQALRDKVKMCSDLNGDIQSVAEMTAPALV